MKITSPWVKRGIKNLGEVDFEIINQFYSDHFEPDPSMNFKFRALRGFFYDANRKTFYWRSLHNLFNKRTFDHKRLKSLIPEGIQRGYFPIRLFQSSTCWLDPRSMGRKTDTQQVMIGNGIAVLESDVSLEDSISETLQAVKLLTNNKLRLIYTGNKSIHIWITDFDTKEWVEQECIYDLECHLEARKRLFMEISKQGKFKFDPQTTIDIRRLIPIVGSLNGFTGRVVTEFTIEQLESSSADEIRERTKVELLNINH